MRYVHESGCIRINEIGTFSLAATLESGQCFRWRRKADGYEGIAFGKYLYAEQRENELLFYCSEKDFLNTWKDYFDLERDYDRISDELISIEPVLQEAARFSKGIRILQQEPWEALCSFVLSQNSNIPKIKLSIERLCESFGEKTEYGYLFPQPEKLADLAPEDLSPLRCGYRAPYVIAAAKSVADGDTDIDRLRKISVEEARQELCRVHGIGVKVADCSLLYGFGRFDCFPVDRWIKAALAAYFPNGTPLIQHPYAGIAQLYIFYMMISAKKGDKERIS